MEPQSLPIKICLIAPKAYPLFNPEVKKIFGGAELEFYILACELAKDARYAVSFVTADYGQPDAEVIEGVTIYKGLRFERNALAGALRIWRAMKRADAEIYMQETASPGTFLVASFCQWFHRAFVYRTAHQEECNGDYLKTHFPAAKGFGWALKRAARVLVQNDQDQAQLKATVGVDSEVIRNAHPLNHLAAADREFILWSGRSAAFKRPHLYLDLARRTPDERFLIICQQATEDSDYQRLRVEAEAIVNLEFIERVPFHAIGEYFERAKMCVNTSESEGFANTFVDACKAGTPILFLCVNPDDFITANHCGYCAAGDWDMFLATFDQLRREADRREQLGSNGRRYVEDNDDIKKIVEEYQAVFETVV